MSPQHRPTFRQLIREADRYAEFYFNRAKAHMLSEGGQPADAEWVVLVQNRFVPLDHIPGCAAMLRRFVRRGLDVRLEEEDERLLKKYWSCLDAVREELGQLLVAEGPSSTVVETARNHRAWPAVGLAQSEVELRALLTLQFERICQARVPWRGVDSSTYGFPMRGGVYVLVDWFWHGM